MTKHIDPIKESLPSLPSYALKCVNPKCERRNIETAIGRAVPTVAVFCIKCGQGMPIFMAKKRAA